VHRSILKEIESGLFATSVFGGIKHERVRPYAFTESNRHSTTFLHFLNIKKYLFRLFSSCLVSSCCKVLHKGTDITNQSDKQALPSVEGQ